MGKLGLKQVVRTGALLLLFGCRQPEDCPPPGEKYYHMDPAAKADLPYSGRDTLSFLYKRLTQSPRVFKYYSQGPDSTFDSEAKQASPSCPPEQVEHREKRTIVYTSKEHPQAITFSLGLAPTFRNRISVLLNYSDFSVYTDFDPATNDNLSLLDSLKVNGKMYYEVKAFHSQSWGDYLYYTRSYGIIKISFTSGETWERIP